MAPIGDNQREDLMQLTLQLRNRVENDKKYAKFHGDNLIGVSKSTTPAGFGTDTCMCRIQSFPKLVGLEIF